MTYDESNLLFDKKYVLLGSDGVKFVTFCPLQVNIKSIRDGFPMTVPIAQCVECTHYLVSGTSRAFSSNDLNVNDYFYCTFKIDTLKEEKDNVISAERMEEDLVDKLIGRNGQIYYFSTYNVYFDMDTFEEKLYSHKEVMKYNKKNSSLYETNEIAIINRRTEKKDNSKSDEIQKKYRELINNEISCSIEDFMLEDGAAYSVYNVKKNKEYIVEATTWGYVYIIDYLGSNNYCLYDDLKSKEWKLRQVIKNYKNNLKNRVIWKMI